MNYRIMKYPQGWVVEVRESVWIFSYWTHFISVSGMENEPWYHHSYEAAEENLLNKIKWQTIKNSPVVELSHD